VDEQLRSMNPAYAQVTRPTAYSLKQIQNEVVEDDQTALLEYAVASASGLTVLRAAGVESERELAFAALHQLCAPLLDRLDRLPGPQRDALATAFGMTAGAVPDRFFIGLAVLGLLSEAAEKRPLMCVIDDAQWLDRASAHALAFVARRMLAESVVLLFALRHSGEEFAGLPELVVDGLEDADARQLLKTVIPGRLDERIADQLLAEARGNPLALLELPHGSARRSWQAVTGCRRRSRRRHGWSRAFDTGSRRCPTTPSGSCWWRPRSQPAIRPFSGRLPRVLASRVWRSSRRSWTA